MQTLVVGLGRRGGDIVSKVPLSETVSALYVDTDDQDLMTRPEGSTFHVARGDTPDAPAPHDPDHGCRVVLSHRDEIEAYLAPADLVLVVAGLGGGTGGGGARAVLSVARELGKLRAALVTRPFGVEGEKRARRASKALKALREHGAPVVDFSQDQLLPLAERVTTMRALMGVADEVVVNAIEALTVLARQAQGSRFEAWAGLGPQALFSYGVADSAGAIDHAVDTAMAGPFLQNVPLGRAAGLAVVVRSNAPIDDAAARSTTVALTSASSETAEVLLARSVEKGVEPPVQVGVFLVGAFGEQRAPSADIWVPGPSG